jgi:dihydrodipicolinate synthase/N-acetylneuraminate lyase
MKVSDPPRGLIVDLITPLNKNGDIDGRGLGQLLDRVLPCVQGVLLASPYMGEGKDLRPSQIEQLLEKSLVVVRGQVPILVWISRNGQEQTKETLLLLKKRLETRKYAGPIFWVDAPLFYHSNRGLPFLYQNLSSMTKEPFILLNDPELIRQLAGPLKRTNIRTAILKELAMTDAIRGLIFLGSLDRSYNYLKAVKKRSDFRIYDGGESRFLKHPSLSGLISAGANLAPMTWRKITVSSLGMDDNGDGYPDQSQQIWEWGAYIQALKDLYEGAAVPLIKQVLSDIGIIDSPACSREIEVDIDERAGLLKSLMKQHGDYPQ